MSLATFHLRLSNHWSWCRSGVGADWFVRACCCCPGNGELSGWFEPSFSPKRDLISVALGKYDWKGADIVSTTSKAVPCGGKWGGGWANRDIRCASEEARKWKKRDAQSSNVFSTASLSSLTGMSRELRLPIRKSFSRTVGIGDPVSLGLRC